METSCFTANQVFLIIFLSWPSPQAFVLDVSDNLTEKYERDSDFLKVKDAFSGFKKVGSFSDNDNTCL